MTLRQTYGAFAAWTVVFFVLMPSLWAQEATARKHIGVPQDWSQGHIVFSRNGLTQHPDLLDGEPRVRHQVMQRWPAPHSDVSAVLPQPSRVRKFRKMHRDWNFNLGGHVSAHMFPAKYSFDATAQPDCINDYVVYGLNVTGVTGGRANLVAFNNL